MLEPAIDGMYCNLKPMSRVSRVVTLPLCSQTPTKCHAYKGQMENSNNLTILNENSPSRRRLLQPYNLNSPLSIIVLMVVSSFAILKWHYSSKNHCIVGRQCRESGWRITLTSGYQKTAMTESGCKINECPRNVGAGRGE